MFSAFQTFGKLGALASSVARAWTPTTLFAAGEAGGLWDFSTLANLYQDSAGTTPCTAVGDPIGLVLDTKNGTPQLGPELVTNGDFSNGTTGWTVGASWTISGGIATSVSTVDDALVTQGVTLTAGKTYQVSYTILARTAGVLRASLGGAVSGGFDSAPGTYTYRLTMPSSQLNLFLQPFGFAGSIDNISVREIPGNHLTQSTSTKRPVLGRMPATGVRNLLTYSEDFSNAVWGKTNGVVAGARVDAPDGTTTAQTFTASGTNATIDVTINGTLTNTIQVMGGVWMRRRTGVGGVDFYAGDGTAFTPNLTSSWSYVQHPVAVGYGPYWLYRIRVQVSGDAIDIWHPQLELGSTATAYQKVGAAYDVTESGVASVYTAYFDGVDDCLVSPSIDFSGTDKMTVWAGCHATATDVAVLCDLGVHLTQTGTFTFLRPNSTGATPGSKFQIYSTPPDKYSSLYTVQAIGTDEVYTLAANKALSTNEVTMRLNWASVGAADFNDDVAGTFGNYPLYVGQRGAASLPYKGFLSALCTRGAATDATTITSMEKWMAARTPGVTLP